MKCSRYLLSVNTVAHEALWADSLAGRRPGCLSHRSVQSKHGPKENVFGSPEKSVLTFLSWIKKFLVAL